MKNIVVFGAGGHAKVVIDILEKQGSYNIIGVIDHSPSSPTFMGYPCQSEQVFFSNPIAKAGIVALGDNYSRKKLSEFITSKIQDFEFIVAVHPSAQIARLVTIGAGTCIMANSTINTNCDIGSHVIINTNSSVDHDCILANYSSIAPNAALGGNCRVGELSAVGLGANIIHKINIGHNCVIGAGATLIKSTEDHTVYLGTPATKKSSREIGQKYL